MNGQGMIMWCRVLACAIVVASAGVSARGQGLVEYGRQLYPAGSGGRFQRIDDGDPTMLELPGGVSNTGLVVGGQNQVGGYAQGEPFMFANGVYESLPVPDTMQGNPVMPWDVSGDGNVAVGEGMTSQGNPHGVGWALDLAGGPIVVDTHLQHGLESLGLNGSALYGTSPDDGNYAVGIAGPVSGTPYVALQGNSDGTDLRMPFVTMSQLTAVSSQGNYSTGVIDEISNPQAVRYEKSSGTVVSLGSLVTGDSSGVFPFDISPDGQFIAGMAPSSVNPGSYEAFGWTQVDGMYPLGFLEGMTWSVANSSGQIGGRNVVVGGAGTEPGGAWSHVPGVDERAFIWIEGEGTMVELEGFLADQLALDLQGWSLSRATGISPDGTYVAGVGISPGGEMGGWVVNMVPEPATMSLLAVGALAVVRRRRK